MAVGLVVTDCEPVPVFDFVLVTVAVCDAVMVLGGVSEAVFVVLELVVGVPEPVCVDVEVCVETCVYVPDTVGVRVAVKESVVDEEGV